MNVYYTRRYNKKVGNRDMSRSLLEKVLVDYCGMSRKTEINTEKRGRKYIDRKYGLHFSITHTDHFWFCSVSGRRNGIDAENLSRQIANQERLAARFFTDREKDYIHAGSDETDIRIRLIRLWTRKEAYLKYTGEGLYGLSHAPSVVDSPEGTDLCTCIQEGLCLSLCAEKESEFESPRMICMDH